VNMAVELTLYGYRPECRIGSVRQSNIVDVSSIQSSVCPAHDKLSAKLLIARVGGVVVPISFGTFRSEVMINNGGSAHRVIAPCHPKTHNRIYPLAT
jgi:hypothetical protein